MTPDKERKAAMTAKESAKFYAKMASDALSRAEAAQRRHVKATGKNDEVIAWKISHERANLNFWLAKA
jgi:hypothetical protein